MAVHPSRSRPGFAVSFVVFAACLAAAQPAAAKSAAAETAVPYAPVKRSVIPTIRREALGFMAPTPYPRRGVMVILSNGLSPSASWITVDVEARRVERARTTTQIMPDGESELILDSKDGGALSLAEVNTVVGLANERWNPSPKEFVPGPPVMDVFCDILLFDGDDVLRTVAPQYDADPLVKAILDLKAGAPARP